MFTLIRFSKVSYCFYCYFEQVSAGWEAKGEIDYRFHLNEFSASKSLYWKQANEINKILFWYFHWNYVCSLTVFAYWKFYTRKQTLTKETIGFALRLATISYKKPRSTARISITSYSVPQHLSWFTNDSLRLKLLLLH